MSQVPNNTELTLIGCSNVVITTSKESAPTHMTESTKDVKAHHQHTENLAAQDESLEAYYCMLFFISSQLDTRKGTQHLEAEEQKQEVEHVQIPAKMQAWKMTPMMQQMKETKEMMKPARARMPGSLLSPAQTPTRKLMSGVMMPRHNRTRM